MSKIEELEMRELYIVIIYCNSIDLYNVYCEKTSKSLKFCPTSSQFAEFIPQILHIFDHRTFNNFNLFIII